MGITIVGQNHNPSILNPDFLWRNRIVPEEMEIVEDAAMSTPLLSRCLFKNGLHIVSEPNRIAFMEKTTEKDGALCHKTAKNYLRIVPLVRYTAVGINFSGSFPGLDGKFAPLDMLRLGGWDQFEDTSPSAGITLIYPLAERTVNLTIQSEKIAGPDSEQKVVFRGNFHHDIRADQGESHKVAIAIVSDWENDLECFRLLTENIAKSIEKQ